MLSFWRTHRNRICIDTYLRSSWIGLKTVHDMLTKIYLSIWLFFTIFETLPNRSIFCFSEAFERTPKTSEECMQLGRQNRAKPTLNWRDSIIYITFVLDFVSKEWDICLLFSPFRCIAELSESAYFPTRIRLL